MPDHDGDGDCDCDLICHMDSTRCVHSLPSMSLLSSVVVNVNHLHRRCTSWITSYKVPQHMPLYHGYQRPSSFATNVHQYAIQ